MDAAFDMLSCDLSEPILIPLSQDDPAQVTQTANGLYLVNCSVEEQDAQDDWTDIT